MLVKFNHPIVTVNTPDELGAFEASVIELSQLGAISFEIWNLKNGSKKRVVGGLHCPTAAFHELRHRSIERFGDVENKDRFFDDGLLSCFEIPKDDSDIQNGMYVSCTWSPYSSDSEWIEDIEF